MNWEEEQSTDADIGEIYRLKLQGNSEPSGYLMALRSVAARSLWSRWGQLRIISRVLHPMDGRDGQPRVVVLRSCVQQTITAVHRDLGHAGHKKTEAHIRRHYWWFLLHNDVADFCRHSTVCAKTKTPTVTPRAPLRPIPVQRPNHRVGIDAIGPLPETRNGNHFIVVMTDYLTKWCETVPVKQEDARTIVSVIISERVSRYGVPGLAFESYLLRETCALLEINKTRTTSYHPEGNGLVERTNRTIKKILTTLVDRYEEERWDEHIPLCMLAYRAAVHKWTGYALAFLQLSHHLRLPSSAETPVAPADLVGSNEYVRSLRERPFAALQIARENIGHHQKTVYDRRSNGPVYEVGDHVFLHRPKAPPGAPTKFHQTWQGPYVIIMKRPNGTYVIRNPSQPHTDVQCILYNQLKPYPQPRNDAQPSTSHYLPPVTTSDTNAFRALRAVLGLRRGQCNAVETRLYLHARLSRTVVEPPRAPDRKE
ncbi:LOW QUALITY PROTEIN: hypothetical protein T265_14204 [Opisthorchis viverrini]|uniref:Integrase catalytic domain-containing protein n=1 Tax=Opisthorchis viverrini TaxID=6198 RepID=A0A074ZE03_OPIVI|nr:LOW QUALITY PROTEIN: hypothetical protein T265_14204 [Opisthorchis viverrini]KER25506.1 LOW QUALITY PROTEIN: hypothetical protein T265_14204 [Opisthorchis viverrini]